MAKTKLTQVGLHMDGAMLAALRAHAAETGKPMTEIMRAAISAYISPQPAKPTHISPEVREAVQGFRAGVSKFRKLLTQEDRSDHDTQRMWNLRKAAIGHLCRCLESSDLPRVMNLSVDEIVTHLDKL